MVILAQAILILQNHAFMWKTLRRGMYAFGGKKKHPRTYLNKNAEDVLLRTENFSLPTTLLQTMALLLRWERWG